MFKEVSSNLCIADIIFFIFNFLLYSFSMTSLNSSFCLYFHLPLIVGPKRLKVYETMGKHLAVFKLHHYSYLIFKFINSK